FAGQLTIFSLPGTSPTCNVCRETLPSSFDVPHPFPGSPRHLIARANEQFNECLIEGVRSEAAKAVIEGALKSTSEAGESTTETYMNIINAANGAQARCLADNPLADLAGDYKGAFGIGDEPVSPSFPWM